jgi:hypothetical protein
MIIDKQIKLYLKIQRNKIEISNIKKYIFLFLISRKPIYDYFYGKITLLKLKIKYIEIKNKFLLYFGEKN